MMGNRLRVTFVTQWYPPEPTPQPRWIAEALESAGLEVQVLTGIPNYPDGVVADGYKAWQVRDDHVGNLSVRRTPLFPSHDERAGRRMLNYASWGLSSTLNGLRVLRRSDVALVYSSPATAALPAMVARALFGLPYVLQIQDIWPDSIFASGYLGGRVGRLAERIAGALVDASYRLAAEVVVISPGAVGLLESRGVDPSKITLVYNWVEERAEAGDGRPCESRQLREELGIPEDAFVLMYAGNHGAAQSLHSVVEAFCAPEMPSTCHLVMIGSGVMKDRLLSHAQQHGGDRVHFIDSVPREQVRGIMAAADAQLVSLARNPLFAVTMPSKLQSILEAGSPVLVAVDGDAATVAETAGAGVSVVPGDQQSLVRSVEDLALRSRAELRHMGKNGRHYYYSHMSEQVGVRRLVAVLERAAERRSRGTHRTAGGRQR